MFAAQNELEHDLVRAANEPAHRRAFLRELLDAEVFLALLLGGGERIETGPGGEAVIPPGARLELLPVDRDGRPAFPFFSSPLRAQEFHRADHVVAPDRVRALLARHPDTEFVLNPGSDYALDLFRADVEALLRGEYSRH